LAGHQAPPLVSECNLKRKERKWLDRIKRERETDRKRKTVVEKTEKKKDRRRKNRKNRKTVIQ
jgi:hypothetical protein